MPLTTRPRAGSYVGCLIVALLSFVSVPARVLAAEESAAPAARSAPLVYADLAATGASAAFGALQLRGGAEIPLAPRLSLGGELGLYWSATAELLVLRADLESLARWRPTGSKGAFLGAGAGLALASVAAAPGTGGASAWITLGFKGLVIAEGGWSFGLEASPLKVEPFVRLVLALGPELSGGQAPGAWQGTAFETALSGASGLRIQWSLQ